MTTFQYCNTTHLTGIELEVLHESLQTKALIAHIYKDICTTVEGAEGQGCIHELLLHCDSQLLKHLIDSWGSRDQPHSPFFPDDMLQQSGQTSLDTQTDAH